MNDERTLLARLRVPLGFLVALLFIVFSSPSWLTIAIGFPLALCGVAIRAWASGHLRKNLELATSGPYAFTRNPLYFGSFIMLAGCVIAGGNGVLALLMMAFFLGIYLPVMKNEAIHMRDLFTRDYRAWSSETPLFFPRFVPYGGRRLSSFDGKQYLKHREYRALLGLLILFGVLVFKVVRGL